MFLKRALLLLRPSLQNTVAGLYFGSCVPSDSAASWSATWFENATWLYADFAVFGAVRNSGVERSLRHVMSVFVFWVGLGILNLV